MTVSFVAKSVPSFAFNIAFVIPVGNVTASVNVIEPDFVVAPEPSAGPARTAPFWSTSVRFVISPNPMVVPVLSVSVKSNFIEAIETASPLTSKVSPMIGWLARFTAMFCAGTPAVHVLTFIVPLEIVTCAAS